MSDTFKNVPAPAWLTTDDAKLGPAMRVLNPRQRAFVVALLDLGCQTNHTRAAMIAGYEGNGNSLKVTAHRLAHDDRVQAAIIEEARKRLTTGTIAAVSYLVDVITSKAALDKDRLKAAQMLLDRGGIHAITEHNVKVEHTDNRSEKLAKLVVLAKAQGVDPRALLGGLSDVIEADYEVIDETTGRDGLEDLLS